MKPILISSIMMSLQCVTLSAQEAKELATTITHVTVFSIGAQVQRTGKVQLAEGKTMIRIEGLAPDLDPESIQVKAGDEVTLLSIQHEWITTTMDKKDLTLDSLNEEIEKLRMQEKQLIMREEVLIGKLDVMDVNRMLGNRETSVAVGEIEKLLQLFESTYMHAKQEQIQVDRKQDSLRVLAQELNKQILEIRGTPLVSKSQIEILVLTDHPVETEIGLSYIVNNAGWIPRYDIRAKDISQPIVILYKAEVHQQTGEVWKNVKLTFSNASPYARQTAPELKPWKLTTLARTTLKRIGASELSQDTRMVMGKVMDENGKPLKYANVEVAGHNLGAQTDGNGDFSIIMPKDATAVNIRSTGYDVINVPVGRETMNINMRNTSNELALQETLSGTSAAPGYYIDGIRISGSRQRPENVTVIIDNQVSVEFELENLSTIESDGKNSSLELQTYAIDADYHYETTPKLDRSAYLIATLDNWEKYHLIEGQANLYFNNTYIGKTILDPLSLSDTLEISLGRDPEVIVERQKEEEFTKRTFLGANTIIEKNFKLSFRNKKESTIHIQVTDQIPVSIYDAITVTATQISGGTRDENSGLIKWNLDIPPTSNKDLVMSYAVKYPSKEKVVLE